jgi:hypothetical protein
MNTSHKQALIITHSSLINITREAKSKIESCLGDTNAYYENKFGSAIVDCKALDYLIDDESIDKNELIQTLTIAGISLDEITANDITHLEFNMR